MRAGTVHRDPGGAGHIVVRSVVALAVAALVPVGAQVSAAPSCYPGNMPDWCTTAPPTTTVATTAPPEPPTTMPAPAATPATPPALPPPSSPAPTATAEPRPALPRTGRQSAAPAAIALSLIVAGWLALTAARRSSQ